MGARPGVAFTISAQDDASLVLQKVAQNAERTASGVANVGRVAGFDGVTGIRKFENALGNLALTQVGLTGQSQRLVEGLSMLALGNPTFMAISGGIALVAGLFALFKNKADEGRRSIDDLITSILKAKDLAPSVQRASVESEQGRLRAEIARITGEQQAAMVPGASYNPLRLKDDIGKLQELRYQLAVTDIALRRLEHPLGTPAGGGSGSSGRGGQGGARASENYLDILRGMNKGPMPETSSPFRVRSPGAELINPNSLHLPEPQELVQALGFMDFAQRTGAIMQDQLAATLGNAISAGLEQAFTGNVGGAFKAFAGTLLMGFGEAMQQQAMAYLQFGAIMKALAPLLTNPFTAGIGGLLIGGALKALGSSLGAGARGGAGGYGGGTSGGGFGSSSFQQQGTSFADGRKQIIYVNFSGKHATINVNDPEDQAAMVKMYDEIGGGGTRQVIFGTPTARRA